MRTVDLVKNLHDRGGSTNSIAAELGISTATVSYHKKRLGVATGLPYVDPSEWQSIQQDIDDGLSHKEVCAKHGMSKDRLTRAYKRGHVTRPKLVYEMTLDEYLSQWGVKEAASHFRRMVKKKMVQEGHCSLSCSICGLVEWRGLPAPLELDHIDGDPTNNQLDNLRILCLHCHTQTPTFGWRNVHKKR